MFCPNCGKECKDGAKFCTGCGVLLSQQNPVANDSESKREDTKKRYRRLILIICIVGAAVIVGLVIWGLRRSAARNSQPDEAAEEIEATEEQAIEEEEVTPADEVAAMSREQIQQDAKDLYNHLVEASASDTQEFAKLYTGAADEDIQSDREYFSSLDLDPTEEQIAIIVIDSTPSIAIQMENYDLEGEFNDRSDDFIMTYTDEGWKKDLSEETSNTVYSHENMEAIYPESYMQAMDAGRNAYEFDGCFLYLDENETFEGEAILKLAFLSQDEDDCVDAYVWAGNGSTENVVIDDLAFLVSDATLGTVLDRTVSCGKTIDPETSELIHLHFDDPADVLTGTQAWTELESTVSVAVEAEEVVSVPSESSENEPEQSVTGQSDSSSSTNVDIALPDFNAEVQYDIDAYCKALRDEYADQNMTTTILFEDGNLVFVGVTYNDKDTGEEKKGCISLPKSSAYTDKTIQDYLCSKCSGTGYVAETVTDRQTCPICGGTGQQYIPNAMYDTIMGWQGIYTACSGCGGMGYIDYTSQQYVTCDKCNGFGVSK